jgi:hypothetical protein
MEVASNGLTFVQNFVKIGQFKKFTVKVGDTDIRLLSYPRKGK